MNLIKDHFADHPFWLFADKITAQEAARTALLNLEKIYGMNSNLILFCCWFALAGQGRLNKQDLNLLITTVTAWHDRVVLALRQINGCFTPTSNDILKNLRAEIQTEALSAEHIEQGMLIEVPVKFSRNSRTPIQKLTDACKNIASYCKLTQTIIDQSTCDTLAQFLTLLFPAIELRETKTICQTNLLENKVGYSQHKLPLD